MKTQIKYLAKEDQTIEEHTMDVVNCCRELQSHIINPLITESIWLLTLLACFLHDIGKHSKLFQYKINNRIMHLPTEIPHGYLSAAFIPTSISDDDFYAIFYAVAYHHHRVVDPAVIEKYYNLYIEQEFKNLDLSWISTNNCPIDITGPDTSDLKRYKLINRSCVEYKKLYLKNNESNRVNRIKHIFIKGLLHRSDYAASGKIAPEIPYSGNYRNHLNLGMNAKGIKLRDYQQDIKSKSNMNVIQIASTGAGKTELAMVWGDGDKLFYLLGLKTAVNAMYTRFQSIFHSNVGLLHGEAVYSYDTMAEMSDKHSKIKQMSYPITIATADQIVPAVFKHPGFETTYVTMSYSKVVIDEIQSFAPEAISAIVVFLKEIVELGGKFLLMTATLPKFIIDELKEIDNTIEMPPVLTQMIRHKYKTLHKGERINPIVEKYIQENKKILIVCNTTKHANKLYKEFGKFNPKMVHSKFIRRDRSKKENELMLEAGNGSSNTEPCLWITTQVVEASLDIDFDILITENASIESLFQRFGRCYRNREYTRDDPNIYIFHHAYFGDVHSELVYDKDLIKQTWNALRDFEEYVCTEQLKQNMLNKIFEDISDTNYYDRYRTAKDWFSLGNITERKSESHDRFRTICNNYVVIPEAVYIENKIEIDQLLDDVHNKKEFKDRFPSHKKLMEYTAAIEVKPTKENLLQRFDLDTHSHKTYIHLLKSARNSYEVGIEF